MKKYFTEVLLITCNYNKYALFDWLYWHIVVIGFNHVVVIDNDSAFDVESLCKLFGDRVEYVHKSGKISQSDLYTEYVNKSDAYWVLPIDDDEFLYVSDRFNNNINTAMYHYIQQYPEYYKFAFNWAMMFSQNLISKVNPADDYFNTFNYVYNTEEMIMDPDKNVLENLNNIKAIVCTNIKHIYSKDTDISVLRKYDQIDYDFDKTRDYLPYLYDKIGSVHNPVSMVNHRFVHAMNVEEKIPNVGFIRHHKLQYDYDTYLFHFKYRTKEEWDIKCNKRNIYGDVYNHYEDHYTNRIIDTIYKNHTMFTKFDKGQILYNKHKEKIKLLKQKIKC